MEQSNNSLSSKKRRWLLLAGVGVVLLACVVTALLLWPKPPNGQSNAGQSDSQTTNLFYDSLENAAAQPKLQVAMLRHTYASKADAEAGQNLGYTTSAVSELDTINGRFRSVWASNYFDRPGFSVGRCMDGATYQEDYQYVNKGPRATSLQDIEPHLKPLPEGHLTKVTGPLINTPCPRFGILPNAPADLAPARLSDGVFPVTLSPEQAKSWRQKVQEARLFTFKDEGTIEKDGKVLRKISFEPTNQKTVNETLFAIFYEVTEIEKIIREQPNAGWQHGFISIGLGNRGSVAGFYLFDEQTKLPAHSELRGIDTDLKAEDGPTALKNIARTKQRYSYPSELTLSVDSPLAFLE